MSPSWNKRIFIRLFAQGATLELWQRWPRRLLDEQAVVFSSTDIHQAITSTAAVLHEKKWCGGIQMVIGNRWLRFSALPWALQSGNDNRDRVTAAGWLAHMQAGVEMATTEGGPEKVIATPTQGEWQINLDRAQYGQDRFFVAINAAAANALQQLHSKEHPLQSWQPWAMQAWNRYRQEIEKANGTLCIAEAGSLGLLAFVEGRVISLQQRHFPVDDMEGLASLLRMEQLRHQQTLHIIADELPLAWHKTIAGFGRLLSLDNKGANKNAASTQEPAA